MADAEFRDQWRKCRADGSHDEWSALVASGVRSGRFPRELICVLLAMGEPIVCAALGKPAAAPGVPLSDLIPPVAAMGRQFSVKFGAIAAGYSIGSLREPWRTFGLGSLAAVNDWLVAPDATRVSAVARWCDDRLRDTWLLAHALEEPETLNVDPDVFASMNQKFRALMYPARMVFAENCAECLRVGIETTVFGRKAEDELLIALAPQFGLWALEHAVHTE